MDNVQPFKIAQPILEHIQQNGFQAYFVGGSVRDFLMNRAINDVDITTSATPDEIETLFTHTIPVGKEHGTINVVWEGDNYEITTFRTEAEYINHRKPSDVTFVRSLYEDVKRRDFTINAIAMDAHFNLYDYFNGKEDILLKKIRTVGQPDERFSEDALRILRGLRFKSQLSFSIETATFEAMQKQIHDLQYLSIERIIVELKKLLHGANVKATMDDLNDLQFWKQIPFFQQFNLSQLHITQPISLEFFIALILLKFSSEQSFKNLKLSNQSKRQITQIKSALTDVQTLTNEHALRQFVYDYSYDLTLTIVQLSKLLKDNHIQLPNENLFNTTSIKHAFNTLPIQQRKDIDIDGQVLMKALDRKGGPWLKTALRDIECAIVQLQINNNQNDILKWVKTNV
ncbi:CCA tRNA nucleotidyltransferase [Staphylococcus sp. 11261D007BR]